MKIKILNPFKNKCFSHPNKYWINHVEEILEILDTLKELNFNFQEEYTKFFAFFHDLGKLSELWQNYFLGKNKLIKHSGLSSFLSFKFLKEEKIEWFDENMNWLNDFLVSHEFKPKFNSKEKRVLTYLIMLHHSDIKTIGREISPTYEDFFDSETLNFLKKHFSEDFEQFIDWVTTLNNPIFFQKEEARNFLHSFAAFKFADILSGSFKRNLKKGEIKKIFYKLGIENIDVNISEDTTKVILSKLAKKVDEKKLKDQMEFLNKRVNILVAPTGFGKTLFSILKGINKNGRAIILLPTITAIQQFLNRSKTIIQEVGYFPEMIGTYYYFFNPFKSIDDENAALNEYFLSRYLFKPLMLTTIDQLLLVYLQTKEFFIKNFALQNRLLIVDEIHLLSPKMLYFLINFLKDYRDLFKDFIFMSATFPEYLIEILVDELNIKKENLMKFYEYYQKDRIWIKVIEEKNYEKLFEIIYEKIKEVLNKNYKKILVIFNTVVKAQEFYEYLREKELDVEIELFHSRFIYKHRKEKERKILRKIDGKKRKTPYILIATQVVEISLDIDFEVLFTEAAPLPELIQRFGRVNRKSLTKPKEPNIYIFNYFDESRKVYEENLMKITLKILKEYDDKGFVNELELIKELDKESFKENFIKLYKETEKEYDELLNKWLKERSQYFYYLFSESEEENLEEISKLLNIRDNCNALVFVNPNDLKENEKKIFYKLINALEKSRKTRDFFKFFKNKLKLREFTLPIPFYYFKDLLQNEKYKIPILPPGLYSTEKGLETRKIKNVKGLIL